MMEAALRAGAILWRPATSAVAVSVWVAIFLVPVFDLWRRAPQFVRTPFGACLFGIFLVGVGLIFTLGADLHHVRGWRRVAQALFPCFAAGLASDLAVYRYNLRPGLFEHPRVLGAMLSELPSRTLIFMALALGCSAIVGFVERRTAGGRSPTGIGPGYQFDTKYVRGEPAKPCLWAKPVPPFKRYESPVAVVALPEPEKRGGEGLWGVIGRRRSRRRFGDEALSLQALSQLLWATQGATGQEDGFLFRAAASAGALYPNETYLVLNRVEGLGPGIGHYNARDHTVSLLMEGEFGAACAEACFGQGFCATAQVVLAWGAVVNRCAQKYADRAYRYIYLDAGHLGGQLQLAAEALGLGSVNIGAFLDDEVNGLFGLDGVEETVVYLTAVGKVR